MRVEIGNEDALEAYKDDSEGPWRYRPYPGQHVTTFNIPDDFELREAYEHVWITLPFHMDMASGGRPRWIESDNAALKSMLDESYGTQKAKRPATWGSAGYEQGGKHRADKKLSKGDG